MFWLVHRLWAVLKLHGRLSVPVARNSVVLHYVMLLIESARCTWNEIKTQGGSWNHIRFPFEKCLCMQAYSTVLTHCQKLFAVIQLNCKKLHESPSQRCEHVAKFLVEVISDLDEMCARYLSTDVPLLELKTQILIWCSSKRGLSRSSHYRLISSTSYNQYKIVMEIWGHMLYVDIKASLLHDDYLL